MRGQAAGAGGPAVQPEGRATGDGDDHPAVGLHRAGPDAAAGEDGLDVLEVDAQPEHLGEPAAPADHLEQAVGSAPGQVAGAQLRHLLAEPEVGRAAGVAHHHVGAGVDQLADAGLVGLGHGFEAERAAGHGHPDRGGPGRGELRRQVRHARGRLGLAVHDEQLEPVAAAELGVRPHARFR